MTNLGFEWIQSYETIRLWVMAPNKKPIPMVWPSFLKEWFFRLKRAGSPDLPLQPEVVIIPRFWFPIRQYQADRRVKSTTHFLLPSPETLAG